MIAWLLVERHKRRTAELQSRSRLSEVMHLNRSAEAGALSASFAHELSQPLSVIALQADAAERLITTTSSEGGRLRELLSDIRQANEHASEIIRHLGKLLKRSSETEIQEFDLNKVVVDACHMLSPEAQRRNITLNSRTIHQPLPVRANRVHVQQVILNLALNGMDAMTDAPSDARRITIQAAPVGKSQVEVTVSDSGTGIPSQKLNAIFATFYTTKSQGSGLGLSIARTIVETYGGKIRAENRPEGGAVFRFTLPLVPSNAAATSRE
jgi:signal transduction histidine kinase